jgi:methylated-DNA-[protein]-cysteine S-methyltransferase
MTTGVAVFPTAIGPCGIAWGPTGITGVQLPERTESATRNRLLKQHPEASPAPMPEHLRDAVERITHLLAGAADDLRDIEVDDSTCSDFARRVYAAARGVAPGQTTTYGEIASQLGAPQAAREVGQALGHNPFPIVVPCHRVLGAGGKLVGFSGPGGVQTKLRMLAIENAAAPDGQTALF